MRKVRIRCPDCKKRYRVGIDALVQGFHCTCGAVVQRRSRWQEFFFFGLGGLFCGLLTGLFILFATFDFKIWWWLLSGLAVAGFLIGGIFGEPGLNILSSIWARQRD